MSPAAMGFALVAILFAAAIHSLAPHVALPSGSVFTSISAVSEVLK